MLVRKAGGMVYENVLTIFATLRNLKFFLFFFNFFNVYLLLLRDRETQSMSRGRVETGGEQNLK